MFAIVGPNFDTLTVRGWPIALDIARETARLIGWARVIDSNTGTNVLVLRRCPD